MVTVIKKGTTSDVIRKKLDALMFKPRKDIRKFAGTVILNIDPVVWQRSIRDEWK